MAGVIELHVGREPGYGADDGCECHQESAVFSGRQPIGRQMRKLYQMRQAFSLTIGCRPYRQMRCGIPAYWKPRR